MFQFLLWIPAVASLALGVTYLVLGEAGPPVKIAGSLWFLGALYLQFGSGHPLAGLLAQTVLALVLAFWNRTPRP